MGFLDGGILSSGQSGGVRRTVHDLRVSPCPVSDCESVDESIEVSDGHFNAGLSGGQYLRLRPLFRGSAIPGVWRYQT